VTAVAPASVPRGWDRGYHARFVQRVRGFADRARDPVKEEARLRAAARRLSLVAEHGRELGEIVWLASQPLDLSSVGTIPEPRAPRHPPSRQPRPRSGSLRASAGARLRRVRQTRRAPTPSYDRRRPRGFVASANGDGTFSVSDRQGRPIRNVALTASGGLVEYVDAKQEPDAWNQSCVCGHDRLGHFDRPEDQDGPCRAACATARGSGPRRRRSTCRRAS